MSLPVKDVFSDALALPLPERAALVEVLMDSFPKEEQAAVTQAWRDEIRRRLEAYDRGEIKAIPAEDVFAELLDD